MGGERDGADARADAAADIAPSPRGSVTGRSPTPRELARGKMDGIVADYVRATGLAEAAGFDLLEVHMVQGYLLAASISPLTNDRDDPY